MMDKRLDKRYLSPIKENSWPESYIFKELGKLAGTSKAYIFTEQIKGEIAIKDLCKMSMAYFNNAIVYFGKGYGYYQDEETGNARPRYYLKHL